MGGSNGPSGWRDWSLGWLVSAPLGLLLWWVSDSPEQVRQPIAVVAVLLGLPWIVPAMIVVAVLSAPVYMWLHTIGQVPPVLIWLGGCVLIAAVIGAHINAAWFIACWRARHRAAETGLGEFLNRSRDGVPREPLDKVH